MTPLTLGLKKSKKRPTKAPPLLTRFLNHLLHGLKGKLNVTPNLKGFQCFKYYRWGHKDNKCTNLRNVISREGKLYFLGEELGDEMVGIEKNLSRWRDRGG